MNKHTDVVAYIGLCIQQSCAWGALQNGPGGPWPTQNFGWVGHNAFGPTNNWPVDPMFVSKISLKANIHSNNGLLLDVVDIKAVVQDFACLNDSRRKQCGCFSVK